jgi:hypothetical protein
MELEFFYVFVVHMEFEPHVTPHLIFAKKNYYSSSIKSELQISSAFPVLVKLNRHSRTGALL